MRSPERLWKWGIPTCSIGRPMACATLTSIFWCGRPARGTVPSGWMDGCTVTGQAWRGCGGSDRSGTPGHRSKPAGSAGSRARSCRAQATMSVWSSGCRRPGRVWQPGGRRDGPPAPRVRSHSSTSQHLGRVVEDAMGDAFVYIVGDRVSPEVLGGQLSERQRITRVRSQASRGHGSLMASKRSSNAVGVDTRSGTVGQDRSPVRRCGWTRR